MSANCVQNPLALANLCRLQARPIWTQVKNKNPFWGAGTLAYAYLCK